jgi:MFS family permease
MKKRDIIVYATVVLALAGLFVYLPPLGIWSNDEAVKFIQMKNYHLHGTLTIDYPGRNIGLGPSDLKPGQLLMTEKDNSLYVIFPPLFPWLSSLFYPLLGERVTHFLPLLAFFLSFVLFDRILQGIVRKPWIRYVLLFTCLGASPVLFFSLTFFEHVPALFMVIASLYFLVRYFTVSCNPTDLLLSSLLLSLGIFFRTEILFLVAASFISQGWSFVKRGQCRSFMISSAGLLIPVVAYGILNILTTGTISGLHIDFNQRIHQNPMRFVMLSIAVLGGFFLAEHLLKKEIREQAQRSRIRAFLVFLFTLLIFSTFRQSPIVILFLQFPVALLLFLFFDNDITGVSSEAHSILRETLLGICFTFMILILFSMQDMHPNVRFALPLIPLIVTVIALDWEKIFTVRLIVAVFVVLVLLSANFLITSIPKDLFTYKMFNAQRVEWLSRNTQPGDVIIFSNKPFMHHAGPLFFDRIFVVENDPDRLTSLFDRLKEKGITRCFFQANHSGYAAKLKAYNPTVSVDVMPRDVECGNSCGSSLYLYRIPLVTD